MKREFLKIYLILDIFVVIFSAFMGKNWLVSSQISFVITIFIAWASFRAYEKLKEKELRSGAWDDISNLSEDEFDEMVESGDRKVKILQNAGAFLSPLKILGYILLGVSFFVLAKFGLLSVLGFMLGVLPLPLGTMIGMVRVGD